MTDNGWLDRRAAEGQREAFREALAKPLAETPPFAAFQKAMRHIYPHVYPVGGLLLDVGCGAGGYAALVDRLWPKLVYLGCDVSPHMIEFAKEDYGDRFFVCDALNVMAEPEPAIILASSVLEVCRNWQEILSHLLALPFEWLILNRVRVWNDDGPTHVAEYLTGYGTTSIEVAHNQLELTRLIREGGGMLVYAEPYQVEPETVLATMVIEKWPQEPSAP